MVSYGIVYPIIVCHCNLTLFTSPSCASLHGHGLDSKFGSIQIRKASGSLLSTNINAIIPAAGDNPPYVMDVPLYLLCLLWGSLVVLVAFACIGGENHTLPPRRVAADDDLFDLAKNGSAPPLATRYNEDDDDYESFDPYATMDAMDEEDWNDMEDVRVILEMNKHARAIKYMHDRKDWSRHVEMLLATREFDQRFPMNIDEFNYLLEALEDAITESYMKSRASTNGNDPIYPEVVMACGLRYLGIGDSISTLSDLYGMSVSSARRAINMFLDAVDYNRTFAPLQVSMPDSNDHEALHNLAERWGNCSTAFGLMNNHLGALDGWLQRTEMPWDVSNQTDYFSGHYQCYGLNVQAMVA